MDLRRQPGRRPSDNDRVLPGEPVAADVANMQALLDQSLQSWLQHLKDIAEKGRTAARARPGPHEALQGSLCAVRATGMLTSATIELEREGNARDLSR